MNKTMTVIKHEFLQTLRRRSFIVMTLIFPLLALAAVVVVRVIQGTAPAPSSAETRIGYVDMSGGFTSETSQPGIELIQYQSEAEAKVSLLSGDVASYYLIPADYVASGRVTRYTLKSELEPPGEVIRAMRDFLLANLLRGRVEEGVIERVQAPLLLESIRLDESGAVAPNQGGLGQFWAPYIFSILLVMGIFTSSGFLLQGLSEEKENRVMEILLSSISARELLTGKVIGLGAAGLVQILVWLISGRFILGLASATFGGLLSALAVPPSLVVFGVVYFILGYLFFAVLMAGVGAVSSTLRESQQLSTIFTLMGVVPFWLAPFIMENPDHVVTQVLTILPPTAPITVMMRLGLTDIPAWQLGLSIAVLIAAIVSALYLSAKVFRAFLLMYGRRPALGEIIRSLRQA